MLPDRRPTMRILLIEDDLDFALALARDLVPEGIRVDHAPLLAEGLALAERGEYRGVLLDLNLPDGNGLDVLRRLRALRHAVPVMIVSGVGAEDSVIGALEAGADDYVVKPISLSLLKARVHALLRRGGMSEGDAMRLGALVVDGRQRAAWAAGRALTLTTLEFDLLAHFAAHADETQSRGALAMAVWGRQLGEESSNFVDVAIGGLRRALGEGPDLPSIESVRGVGYMLRSPGKLEERAAQARFARGG